jgi:hypothetical protein
MRQSLLRRRRQLVVRLLPCRLIVPIRALSWLAHRRAGRIRIRLTARPLNTRRRRATFCSPTSSTRSPNVAVVYHLRRAKRRAVQVSKVRRVTAAVAHLVVVQVIRIRPLKPTARHLWRVPLRLPLVSAPPIRSVSSPARSMPLIHGRPTILLAAIPILRRLGLRDHRRTERDTRGASANQPPMKSFADHATISLFSAELLPSFHAKQGSAQTPRK